MLGEKVKCGNTDYDENWLYFYIEETERVALKTFKHLGIVFTLYEVSLRHKLAPLFWKEYIVEADDGFTAYVAGQSSVSRIDDAVN